MLIPEFTIGADQLLLSNQCPVRADHLLSKYVKGPYPLHDHEFIEITIILDGSVEHLSEGGVTELGRGSIILILPGQVHGFPSRTNLESINVYYLSQWLIGDSLFLENRTLAMMFLKSALFPAIQMREPLQFEVDEICLRQLAKNLNELRAETAQPGFSTFTLKLIFLRFLDRLSRAFEARFPDSIPTLFRPEVWRAVQYIETVVTENKPLVMKTLETFCGARTGYLTQLFRHATGITPTDYYQSRRIQHTARYLLNKELTLTEIAHRAGFADSAHFTRLFSREMKLTPSAYRKRYCVKSG